MDAALDEHYRRFFPLIREKCRRMLTDGDEAQDVAQETFIRLWQKGPSLADPRHATAWAYQTSTRLAVDMLRRRAARGANPAASEAAPGPDEALAARQLIEALAGAVGEGELEAAILARVDGLSQLEVAEVLGVSERTVRRLLTRFDEAIAYASRLTIRDTAARAPEPQHPSFDLRLRGRQDVVLAAPGGTKTLLTLEQTEGPLELVELSTGVVVLEATPGAQRLLLAVAPGDYLVRRVAADGVRSREVSVRAGEASRVDEVSLTVRGEPLLSGKGASPPLHRWSLGASAGPTLGNAFTVGLKIEGRAELRFLTRLAVRLRAAGQQNFPTGLRDQLQRDFGVLPTAFNELRLFGGVDAVVYPWWSERYGRGFGVALQVSAGGGVGGLPVAAIASAETGLSFSLGATGLFADLLVTEHLVFWSPVTPMTTISVALSWAFL